MFTMVKTTTYLSEIEMVLFCDQLTISERQSSTSDSESASRLDILASLILV